MIAIKNGNLISCDLMARLNKTDYYHHKFSIKNNLIFLKTLSSH